LGGIIAAFQTGTWLLLPLDKYLFRRRVRLVEEHLHRIGRPDLGSRVNVSWHTLSIDIQPDDGKSKS
jgi:hypothetical protein